MNNALTDLQTIAQMLDRFMEEHGNSRALESAADYIADELQNRDVTVTRVLVRHELYVDVKHARNVCENAVHQEAISYAMYQEDSGDWYCIDGETDDGLLGFEDTEVE